MRLFSTFIILILISSCKKENLPPPYNFAGKVTGNTGNPIPNAKVELLAYYSSSNAITPGGLYKLGTANTNSGGEFRVFFNQSDGIRFYQVNVFAEGYFSFLQEHIDAGNFQNGQLIFDPHLFRIATIRIRFRNVSPVSNADEFQVFQENELFGGGFNTFIERQFTGGTFNELEHTYIGSSLQGFELTKTKGDTYTYLDWTSKKNGVNYYKRDSVFIAGGTEGSYTVNY